VTVAKVQLAVACGCQSHFSISFKQRFMEDKCFSCQHEWYTLEPHSCML